MNFKNWLFLTIWSVSFLIYGIGIGYYNWFPYALIKTIPFDFLYRSVGVDSTFSVNGTKNLKINIKVTNYSNVVIDKYGNPVWKDGHVIRTKGKYSFIKQISKKNTAVIVIDPWIVGEDDPARTNLINTFYNSILPLVKKSINLGIKVFVFSKDPSIFKRSGKIPPKLYPELVELDREGALKILYHTDFDTFKFTKYLRSSSIDTLIYSGFASNICLIGRSVGLIPMGAQRFRTFFVPEASAASEYDAHISAESAHMHTTMLISHWSLQFGHGGIIHLADFLNLGSHVSSVGMAR